MKSAGRRRQTFDPEIIIEYMLIGAVRKGD